MPHLLACLLAILIGLTFALTASVFDVPGSDLWIGNALAFGLIASSIPALRRGRRLRDIMIAIALFALYTGAMVSVRDQHMRSQWQSNLMFGGPQTILMIGD